MGERERVENFERFKRFEREREREREFTLHSLLFGSFLFLKKSKKVEDANRNVVLHFLDSRTFSKIELTVPVLLLRDSKLRSKGCASQRILLHERY